MRATHNHAQRGLVLVKAAVFLFIVGLFLAGLASVLLQKEQSERLKDEKTRVRAARDEVIGYAVRTCRLPNPNAPELWTPSHNQGRLQGERILYLPNPDLLNADLKPKPGGGYSLTRGGAALPASERVAFFVVGQGANRRVDLDLARAPVPLPNASEQFDDTVDYATVGYLASLSLRNCASSEDYVKGGGATPAITPKPGYKGPKNQGYYLNPWSQPDLLTGQVSSQSPHDGGAAARLGLNGGATGVWEQGLLIKNAVKTAHLSWSGGTAKDFDAQYDGQANQIRLRIDAQTLVTTLPAIPEGYARVLGNFYLIAYAKQGNETVSVTQLAVDGSVLPAPYDALSANGGSNVYSYTLSQREQSATSLRVSGQVALSDARAPANDADTGISVHFQLYDVSPIVISAISPERGAAGVTVTLQGASFPTFNPSVFFEDVSSGTRLSATILSASASKLVCLAPNLGAGVSARVYVKGAQSYEYSNVAYFEYN